MSEIDLQWLFWFAAFYCILCVLGFVFYTLIEYADELKELNHQAIRRIALPICYQVDYRSKGLSFSEFEADITAVGLENCIVFKVMKRLS